MEDKGLLYIGTGVSGGEEGALLGPSIMPGGSPAAWPIVKPIFQAIAAKVEDGTPCCDWVGEDGAGHFVKMVHNGIEYGDMQLICEAYDLLQRGLGLNADELHEVFAEWNKGELDSYLIEISRDIFGKKDEDGQPIVDKILDTAGQKGTGKWTSLPPGRRPATNADRRGGFRAMPFGAERRAREASKVLKGSYSALYRPQEADDRRPPAGAVRQQDSQLCAGVSVDAVGGQDLRVEPQLRRDRQ